MYNIRYHIASLVSVFLALALGLVLGGLIVDKSASPVSQTSLVSDLKQEFATLRADNMTLQTNVDAYDAFSSELTKKYLSTALAGKTVAVLGLNSKATQLAHDDIVAMGGKPVLVNIDLKKLNLKDAESQVTTVVAAYMAAKNTRDANQSIGEILAGEWTPGVTARPLSDALVKEGVLSISDYAKFAGVDGVVDTAVDTTGVNSLGLKITDAFKNAGKPALCMSMFGGSDKLATQGWKKGISSTNVLSTPIGTYTIAAIMNGAEDGLYGTMEGAKAVYPAMPQAPAVTTK